MHTILLVGEKQSGKSSAAEFIHNKFSTFNIKDSHIRAHKFVSNGVSFNSTEQDIPVYSQDPLDLIALAPAFKLCKIYNFADLLKHTVSRLYNIPLYRAYGTEVDKDQLTDIKWSKLSSSVNDVNLKLKIKQDDIGDKCLTVRELLQWFATICKKLDDKCFINNTIRQIKEDKSNIAIIADCRYIEEFNIVQELNPINIRLIAPNEDMHSSEKDMRGIPLERFDLVLEKNKNSLEQKNHKILELLKSRGLCT